MRAVFFAFSLTAASTLALAQRPHLSVEMQDGGVTEILQSIVIPPLVDAPFTAIVHTEWTRPLPDGGSYTYINQRRIARDSRGRIYEERWWLVPKDGKQQSRMNVIQIADPHQHTLYNCFLLNQPHRCNLLKFAEVAISSFRQPILASGPIPDGSGYIRHENLGGQTFEGLETIGTRDTVTYNPGTFGNDRSAVTTREFWHSDQLGINLLSIVEGPRIGRQTFTVTDIRLGEPDTELFQLPQGFEILDRWVQ